MTKEQITKLIAEGQFPGNTARPELVETHISWVIICDEFVYKIKKPVQYSFLDFSTLEKRKYYCEKEIELNKRLTDKIYLDVVAIKETMGHFAIDGDTVNIIEYAVRMRKMNRSRQMNILLLQDKVSLADIKSLGKKIASFHQNAAIVKTINVLAIKDMFNDLTREKKYLSENLGVDGSATIGNAIARSNTFIAKSKPLLTARLEAGFFRDCHGDLHSGNIFLLQEPEPFDCIEFNDDYRRVDVLNEVAFLCMDMDAYGRQDLSNLFISSYNNLLPVINTAEEQQLFIYYKAYRANIRAKVNSLRARDASDNAEKELLLADAGKYLRLMDGYMKLLPGNQ